MNEPTENFDRARGGRRNFNVIEGAAAFGGRTLPHSIEAEEHFLACCLLPESGQATLARARAAQLVPSAFYTAANQVVYSKIVAMQRLGIPVDIATVAQELQTSGELEAAGGVMGLARMADRAMTSAQAGYFLEKLLELWVLREWIRESSGALEKAYGYDGGLEDLLGKHAARMQRMADFSQLARRESQRDQAAAARASALAAAAGEVDRTRWCSFGLPYADEQLLHFDVRNEDWLVIVAGPPSGGKSSLMRWMAGANCRDGKAGVVFLLETSFRRWVQALAATFAKVDLRNLHELPKARLAEFDQAMAMVEGWVEERLWVFDDVYHLEDIERVTREVNRQVRERKISAGEDPATAWGLDFAVVDYLQLVDLREKFRGQREEKVAAISKGLKKLLKSLNITGLVGAQLNRKSREEARRPRLTDLRESGSIEQDADGVLAVFTPECDASGVAQDGSRSVDEVELIQLKRRNGPRDVAVDLLFHKQQTRYTDAKTSPTVRPGLPKISPGYHQPTGGGR